MSLGNGGAIYDERVALARPGILHSLMDISDKMYLNETAVPVSDDANTAYRAYFVQVQNPQQFAATHAWWSVGSVGGGNFDMGVYALYGDQGLSLLGNIGSTAVGSTGQVQATAFSSPLIIPSGPVVLAIQFDTATTEIMCENFEPSPAPSWNNLLSRLWGFSQEDFGSLGLPVTTSATDPITPFFQGPPIFGVSNRMY